MKLKHLLLSAISFIFIASMNAQFKIDAQYRVRGQALHGYKKPVAKNTDAAFHIGQRTRLNLRYNNEKFSSLISFQDVRIWGDENNVNGTGVVGKNYNNTDLYEAWINFKFGNNDNLKIGRQELKYDDQRHISWRNWWDSGMTYDAITYTHDDKASGWRFDISGSYNSKKADLVGNDYSDGTGYFGAVNPILTHNFIYIKKRIGKLYVSLLGIAAGYQKEGTKNVINITGTEGIHINYNATKKGTDGLFFVGNAFMQNGKNISGKSISANMFTAQLGYRTMKKKLELSGKVEYLSGHDAKNTDADYNKTVHTYNLLYGGRHPYYEGYLDWFVVPKSTLNGGLMNLAFELSYKASKKDILKFGFSNISLATNVKKVKPNNTVVNFDKGALANTIDFTYIRKVNKTIKWMNGFSYGMPTDDFNKMKGITDPGKNYFFYTMLIVQPKLFDSSKK